ncbi:site-specific integrase [Aeromonas caviae]|uniref:site-specific integrase n=1 Tax=Aeromonas caviae TaxID=648 RepID=UPI000FEB8FF5|nr:site-specific integrase [Aeromonas caviae]RWT35045.1 hypothetical protein DN613_18325 [Aeromonas caviae]
MAIMPNPKKDPKTGVYKIRQVIPPALRPFVEGNKGELKRSLDTKDPQEAKSRAFLVQKEFHAILANARSLKAQQESKVALTFSQIRSFAEAWREREELRLGDPDILARYVLCEYEDDSAARHFSSHGEFYGDALSSINPKRLCAAMREFAQECLALAQVELASDDPLYAKLCMLLADHCVSICKSSFKNIQHQIDERPKSLPIAPLFPSATGTTAPSEPDALRLSAFFKTLADEQGKVNPKGAKTWRRERESVVRRFIEAFGDLPLNRITKPLCIEFRNLLMLTPYRPNQEIEQLPFREQVAKAQQEGLPTISLARVKGIIRLLSGILERAHGDALIPDNPCHGVKIEVPKATRDRAPEFSDAEMNTLFGSGLFTGNIRPQRAQFGEAIYWVPVLLAYTGARSEEVCQLFRRDVEQKNGQWVIHIRDWDESQSVKTGKEREVPLHPHLLELGFERFLANRSAAGPLFPELVPSQSGGRYSVDLGKWLRKQISQILELKAGSISPIHAFRHTFITHMRELGIREDLQNAITGHSQGSNVGRRYGSFRQLHEAICQMPRWPVPVWQPLGVIEGSVAAVEVQS